MKEGILKRALSLGSFAEYYDTEKRLTGVRDCYYCDCLTSLVAQHSLQLASARAYGLGREGQGERVRWRNEGTNPAAP